MRRDSNCMQFDRTRPMHPLAPARPSTWSLHQLRFLAISSIPLFESRAPARFEEREREGETESRKRS